MSASENRGHDCKLKRERGRMNGRSAEFDRYMRRLHRGIRPEIYEGQGRILPVEKLQRIIVFAAGQLCATSYEEGTS
jgi:hypothetical protein